MSLFESAVARHRVGDLAGAEIRYRAMISAGGSEMADGWQNLAVLTADMGKLAAAAAMARKAVDLRPGSADARCNLGNILWRMQRFEDAEPELERALEIDPGHFEARQNLGLLAYTMGDPVRAVEQLRVSFSVAPAERRLAIAGDLGAALLMAGELERGFAMASPEWGKPATLIWDLGIPPWYGDLAELRGARVLVHDQGHGLGDTIQFCRFLPVLRAAGAYLVASLPSPLCRLIDDSGLVDEVISPSDRFGAGLADFHVPLALLPFRLGIGMDDLKRFSEPYLTTRSAHVPRGPGQKIGLIWAANQSHTTGGWRSVPLEVLLPVAALPDVSVYSLQVGECASDVKRLGAEALITELAIRDFADLAVLMARMDLIISADTAPLHLSGALGRPTIGLLSLGGADWRWLSADRQDSPWYPNTILLRQKKPGDWDGLGRDLLKLMGDARLIAERIAA